MAQQKIYTKEMFLIAAEKCEVSMIDAKHIMKYIDEYVTPIELPSDEEIDMAQQSKIGNSDNSQTAMQEFIEWVISLKDKEQQCIDWICIKSKSEDLLTKEKEQIKDAYWNGTVDMEKKDALADAEKFYNEYYKN
jgi:hypothetical protein